MNNITFSQFFDEDGFFNKEFNLTFGMCDRNGKLSLQQLLLMTSDTAVEDFNQRGFSWDMLWKHNMYILTSRVSFHIYRMPKYNEHITLKTWEEKQDNIQLNRKYKIYDTSSNELLVSGNSSWIVVNTKTRHIIPARSFTLRPSPTIETEYEGLPLGKIVVPEDCVQLEKRKVRFSDIDGNRHTNNSRYGDFIIDALPENLQDADFSDIRINYSHEAIFNETIDISASFKDKETIVVGKQGKSTCFECKLQTRS